MKFDSLTFFRFIAATIVVIFHFGRETVLVRSAPELLIVAPHMVPFFFVLSGFVLTFVYWDREPDTKKYLRARIVRIFPTYYLALGAALLLETVPYGNQAVLLNALLLHAWFPPYPMSINGPSWTLSVEIVFYLAFPFLLWILHAKPIKPRNLLGIAFIYWFFTQLVLTNLLNTSFYKPYPSISHDLIYYFPPSHFSTFFLGMAGGYFYLHTDKKSLPRNWILTLAFLATCIFIYYAIYYGGILTRLIGMQIPFLDGTYAPLFLIMVLLVAFSQGSRLQTALGNRFFALLGNASYGFYIFQRPFHQLLDTYLFPSLNLSDELSFYVYFTSLTLFSILIVIAFERPVRKLLMRKT